MRIRSMALVATMVLVFGACQPAAVASPSPAATVAATGTPAAATAAPTAAPATAAPATAAPAMVAPTAAPTTAAPTPAPTASAGGSVLRFTRPGGVTPIWHPNARDTGVQIIVFELIFSNLLDRCWQPDGTFQLCPDLAESWSTTDGQTYTFNLRRDVIWHDGTPFTARDVAFTMARSYLNVIRFSNQVWDPVQGAEEIKAGTTTELSGVKVIDDYTIEITLQFPDASWPNELPEPYGSIVPEHILKDTDPKQSDTIEFSTTKPIGTGPYKYVTYVADQYVEMVANPDYFKGAPKIQQIFYRLMGGDAAVAAVEAGEVHLAVEINPAERERLSGIADLDLISNPGVGNHGFFFNLLNVPDARTRKAVGFAIDAQGIVDAVYGGAARLNRGVQPGMPAPADTEFIDYNPERATELLGESDWDVSKPFRIAYDSNAPGLAQYMPIMQQQLEAIGMTVELLPIESAAFIDFWNQIEDWEVVVTYGGDQGVHPLRTQIQYKCNLDTPAYFQARKTDCRIDDMFVQARREPDDAKRQAIFEEITRILSSEGDYISFFTTNTLTAKVKGLSGLVIPSNSREFAVGAEKWTLTE